MKLMNSELKVIQPSGELLDGSVATQLCQEVNQAVGNGARIILIDLGNVSFIDSSGLGGLVRAFKSTKDADGRLILCSICEQGRMLVEITGMDQFFEIFADRTAFMNSHPHLALESV